MDMQHREMMDFLGSQKSTEIFCPDYLESRLRETFASTEIVPHCASGRFAGLAGSLVVLHKGLLSRLPMSQLTKIAVLFEPLYANDVFVVYRRSSKNATYRRPTPELLLHVAPVHQFLRNWTTSKQKKRPSIAAIVSAWGVGNIGDDAVSLAARLMCEEVGISETRMLGPNGDYRQIDDADLLIVGGGGLFYDTDIENVSNYTAPLIYAADRGIPTAVLGVGTQGIKTRSGRSAFQSALSRASLVSVRDGGDLAVLQRECGLDNVYCTADLAFSLDTLQPSLGIAPQPHLAGRPNAKIALVSLSKLIDSVVKKEGFALRTCVDLIEELKGQDYEVILAEHSEDDHVLYSEIVSECDIKRVIFSDLGIKATLEIYASAEVVITSRFHGVVFASLSKAKISVVCSRMGKTGRMISHDLMSILPATKFLDSTQDNFDVRTLLAASKIPSQVEVDQLRENSLLNIELLRGLFANITPDNRERLGYHNKPRDLLPKVNNQRYGCGVKNEEAASPDHRDAKAITDDVAKVELQNARIVTDIPESLLNEMTGIIERDSGTKSVVLTSSGIARIIEDCLLPVKNGQVNIDVASFNNENFAEFLTDTRNVTLICLDEKDLIRMDELAERFPASSFFCVSMYPSMFMEDDFRRITVGVGLENLTALGDEEGRMVDIPIFKLGEYEGAVIFKRVSG
jgi:polysaccharide pyruvyl transferase WcaK-like protein